MVAVVGNSSSATIQSGDYLAETLSRAIQRDIAKDEAQPTTLNTTSRLSSVS